MVPPVSLPRIKAFTLALLLASCAARGQTPDFSAQVRGIPFKSGLTELGDTQWDVHYCLYFGDEQARLADDDPVTARATRTLMLLHPVPEVAQRMQPAAPHRWFVIARGGSGTTPPAALLVDAVWKRVPTAVRHVLAALGLDDPDLILISCRLDTGTISVFYHPRFDRDRALYECRLDALKRYLRVHAWSGDLPLGNLVHRDTGAA
jgi:hypothetical protein